MFRARQGDPPNGKPMIAALPLALALSAEAPAQVPAEVAQSTVPAPDLAAPAGESEAPPPADPAEEADCGRPSADSRVIVICGQRTQGYRLNPDVMQAKRELRNPGRPTSPYPKQRPDCETVGPAPCMVGGVSIIGAVLTAAEMAKRVAEGKEIGSMFTTDPHPTEYQLYQMAKAKREEREAEQAAAAKAKARAAAQAAQAAQPSQSAEPQGEPSPR